jgi:hypothetical protein
MMWEFFCRQLSYQKWNADDADLADKSGCKNHTDTGKIAFGRLHAISIFESRTSRIFFEMKFERIKKKPPVQVIGRREIADFPDLGLFGLVAKIDTGANTTALHCHHVRVENGVLFFRLLDESHPEYDDREHRFEYFEEKLIRNSFGQSELRYVVRTTIVLGKRKIKSIISLSDRGQMRYPVLIGRRLLKNRFNVDVSLLNALSDQSK